MHFFHLIGSVFAAVQLDIGRMILTENGPRQASRHQQGKAATADDSVVIGNDYYYYYATIGLGTPPQPVHVQIDTGSSDLWVMDSANPYCRLTPDNENYVNCSDYVVFSPGRSSTYQGTNHPFSIQYADSSFAHGHMAQDVVQLGQYRLPRTNFALASRSNSGQVVMGIGFKDNESTDQKYNNVPLALKAQGLIHSNSYSLWLDDVHATSGSLLFGAVDHTKYSNTLGIVPIVKTDAGASHPDQMTVMLHGIRVAAENVQPTNLVDCSIPVLFDSGTSFAYLPSSIAHTLGSAIGMRYDRNSGMYIGPYPKNTKGYFEFNFSGVGIKVPVDLLVDPFDGDSSGKTYELLVAPSDDDNYILGDAFLRAAYIVYDLDNYEIGIGQAKYNVQASNIEDISQRIPGKQARHYSATKGSYVRTVNLNAPINLAGQDLARGIASAPATLRTITKRTTITVGPSRTVMPFGQGVPTSSSSVSVSAPIYTPQPCECEPSSVPMTMSPKVQAKGCSLAAAYPYGNATITQDRASYSSARYSPTTDEMQQVLSSLASQRSALMDRLSPKTAC